MAPERFADRIDYCGREQIRICAGTAGIPGPTAAAIGSLSALEAIRILTGKEPAYSNQLLYFDGESGVFEMVPL